MSNISITIERIESIVPHTNADALEIAKILGTQVVVRKGEYKQHDLVVFFPPDILLPEDISERLGVKQYLKFATLNGGKCQCRVAACRLRGAPSYGFITPFNGCVTDIGADVTAKYFAQKFIPSKSSTDKTRFNGELAPQCTAFHKYTDIQHYWKYAKTLIPGTPVRITEKIHGTNSRVGLINNDGWQFMAGSHKIIRKKYAFKDVPSLYWKPLDDVTMLNLLTDLCNEQHDVVVFGEIFGPGIQDLDYGGTGYRVFDISVDGTYLDYDKLVAITNKHQVQRVPTLYVGSFLPELLEEHTYGPTLVGKPNCKFKGREGCVITPLTEQWDAIVGRVILKSVSADYLNRKHAIDNR